jgi:hypothetical protein
MTLRDLTLDFDNKKISNTFLKGKKLILQEVVLALQCWTGDWFLDGTFGIPYDVRLENKSLLLADIQEVILSVNGVNSVQNIEVESIYEGPKNTQLMFKISALVVTRDDEQILFNGLIPIIGV